MRTENIYSVYVHKNLKNDKYYVGSTKQNLNRRWRNGLGYKKQPNMWKDIQESDWNSDWCHGILGKFDNKDDALNYEAFLIAMLDSVRNGYNTSSFDSNHYKRSEEHKKRISESMTGIVFTEEHKKKISEAMTGNHNRPQKSVLQLSINGEFIAEYPSTREAEIQTGCNSGNICSCCMGKYKSAGGYLWRYAS